MLAGPQGKLYHRWKSLYLCIRDFNIGKEIAYPTPNLEAIGLELPYIARNFSILPSIPKLKTLEIFMPYLFTLPKIENVRDLAIFDLGSCPSNFSNIKTATKLETLTIETSISDNSIPYSLPKFLPHVSSMSFIGHQLPHNLNELQVPNIHKLSLRPRDNIALKTIVVSSLPFWNLQELELTWPPAFLPTYRELKKTTSEFILSCVNLTCIKGEKKSLSVIVKLYWEWCATRNTGRKYITGKTLTFWSRDVAREVSRPEGKSELEGVARYLRLIPPSMSWDDMLVRL